MVKKKTAAAFFCALGLATLTLPQAWAFSEDICYQYANKENTAINPAPFNCWDMQCKDATGASTTTKGSCAVSGVATYAEASVLGWMHVRNSLHFDVLYLLGRMHGMSKEDARTLAVYGEAPDLGAVKHFDYIGKTVVAASDDISGLQRTNVSTPGMWWHYVPWVQPDCDPAQSACQTESTLSYSSNTGTASPYPAQEIPLAHIRAWAFGTQSNLCNFGMTQTGSAVGNCFDSAAGKTLYWDLPLYKSNTNADARVNLTQTLQWQPIKKVDSATSGAYCLDEAGIDGATTKVCYSTAYASENAKSIKALGAYLHSMGDRLSHYHCSDGAFISKTFQGEGAAANAANYYLYYQDICGTVAHAMFHYPESGQKSLPERSEKMIEYSHQEIMQWINLFYADKKQKVTANRLYPDPASVTEVVNLIAYAISQGAAADRLSGLCKIARNGYNLDWHDDNPNCVYPADASNPSTTATAGIFATDSGSALNKKIQAGVTPSAADLGQTGSIYVILNTPLGWFLQTPQGFTNWKGGDVPAYFTGILQETTIPILDGSLDLRTLRGTDIYVGYGKNAGDMVSTRKFAKVSTIQGSRAKSALRAGSRPR